MNQTAQYTIQRIIQDQSVTVDLVGPITNKELIRFFYILDGANAVILPGKANPNEFVGPGIVIPKSPSPEYLRSIGNDVSSGLGNTLAEQSDGLVPRVLEMAGLKGLTLQDYIQMNKAGHAPYGECLSQMLRQEEKLKKEIAEKSVAKYQKNIFA